MKQQITTLPQALARIADLEETVAHLREKLGLETQGQAINRLIARWKLTPNEARLLEFLAAKKGEVARREALMDVLYGGRADEPEMKIIDVFACKVRAKIGGRMMATVWGQGYRLTPEGLAEVQEVLAAEYVDLQPLDQAPPREPKKNYQLPVLEALAKHGPIDIRALKVKMGAQASLYRVRNAMAAAKHHDRVRVADWKLCSDGFKRTQYAITDAGRAYLRDRTPTL